MVPHGRLLVIALILTITMAGAAYSFRALGEQRRRVDELSHQVRNAATAEDVAAQVRAIERLRRERRKKRLVARKKICRELQKDLAEAREDVATASNPPDVRFANAEVVRLERELAQAEGRVHAARRPRNGKPLPRSDKDEHKSKKGKDKTKTKRKDDGGHKATGKAAAKATGKATGKAKGKAAAKADKGESR